MPFQSKQQQRFMFAKHPTIAKRWAKETPNMKKLPKFKGVSTGVKRKRITRASFTKKKQK